MTSRNEARPGDLSALMFPTQIRTFTAEDLVVTAGNPLVIAGAEPVSINVNALVLEDGAQVVIETEAAFIVRSAVSEGTGTFLFTGQDGAPGPVGAPGAPGHNGEDGQAPPSGTLRFDQATGTFVVRVVPGSGGAGGKGGDGGAGPGGAGGAGGNGGNGSTVVIYYNAGSSGPPVFRPDTPAGTGGANGRGGTGDPPGAPGAPGHDGTPGRVITRTLG